MWCCLCGEASPSSEGSANSDELANNGESSTPLGDLASPFEVPISPISQSLESEEQEPAHPSNQFGPEGNTDNTNNDTDLPSQCIDSQEGTDDPLCDISGLFPVDEDPGTNEWGSPQPRAQERDLPMPPGWLREQGSRVLRWIENAGEPACTIPRQTLTFQQIVQDAHVRVEEYVEFPPDLRELPQTFETASDEPLCTLFSARYLYGMWIGRTAPGVIIMENIIRHQPATDQPHCNELALAFYTRDYPIESLKNVFVTGIQNLQTRGYLESHLYKDFLSQETKDWNSYSSETEASMHTRAWERDSEEFETLMGTRIGRTVGYLVLCGFPRGTRRIARIWIQLTYIWNYRFEFRFDIEPISLSASPPVSIE